MASDVPSYWRQASLTPSGLLHYARDEIALYQSSSSSIDLEFGEVKAHAGGAVVVTTHRVVWMHPKGAPVLALGLEAVERAELKGGGMLSLGFSTPRIVIHKHDPAMMAWIRQQYAAAPSFANASSSLASSSAAAAAAAASSGSVTAAPAKSSVPRFARLAFRGEAPGGFLAALNSALHSGAFRASFAADPAAAASPHSSSGPSAAASSSGEFRTTGAGISGIVRSAHQRERDIDRTLEAAFSDLDTLMSNARGVVDLAARLAASREMVGADESKQKQVATMLEDMGITNPVTRAMVGEGSGSSFHLQLAREMADFLPKRVDAEGGMLLLTDAYCLVNRARGTQLISPLDCLTAAGMFAQINTPLRLQSFADSGVKVIIAGEGAAKHVSDKIRRELEEEAALIQQQRASASAPFDALLDAPSLSPLQLSDRWHISIILAKQYLCVAEQQQVLCRDESIHGLTFCINQF